MYAIRSYYVQSNSVVFTSTNWSDGGCSTDLYTYQIELDSLLIEPNWASCDEFNQNKDEILKDRGLGNLVSLPSVDIPYFITFRWDQPVRYFSVRRNENTYNRPFTLTIFKHRITSYNVCYTKLLRNRCSCFMQINPGKEEIKTNRK